MAPDHRCFPPAGTFVVTELKPSEAHLPAEIKGQKSRSPNTNMKQNFHSCVLQRVATVPVDSRCSARPHRCAWQAPMPLPADEMAVARCSDQFCIDIVGMLSIGKALQGGDSRWVSSVTVHNELLRRGRRVRFKMALWS